MILTKFKLFLTIIVSFAALGCSRNQNNQDDIFSVSLTNYPMTEFATFQPFQAIMAEKQVGIYIDKHSGKTNFYFTIVLEKTNGQRFVVFENPASLQFFQLANSLEKGSNYAFPNSLISNVCIIK